MFHASAALLLGKEPTKSEDGWAPELLWMFWRREKYLAPAQNQTLVHEEKLWIPLKKKQSEIKSVPVEYVHNVIKQTVQRNPAYKSVITGTKYLQV
jgi:hypothetical protein